MILRDIALSVLLSHTPIGQTVLSVETMPECGLDAQKPTCAIAPVCTPATNPLCKEPRWSDWHDAWVRVEAKETAKIRYAEIALSLETSALKVLCLNPDGTRIQPVKDAEGNVISMCKPIKWGYVYQLKRNRGTVKELLLSAQASMILESGAREDVQVGRGRHKKPDSVGGLGRGPGNEACMMQIIPHMAYRFADWITDEEREKAKNSKLERERIAQQLLGRDQESLQRCFTVGLRMLAHSRQICRRHLHAWYKNKNLPVKLQETYWWAMGMYSYYGVGPSGNANGCYDFNRGKTLKRVRLLERLLATTHAVTWESPTNPIWKTVQDKADGG